MTIGITQGHQLRVTIYRKPGKAPLVFGINSGIKDPYKDLRQVSIGRRMNQPANVSVVVPGRRSAVGGLWSDEVTFGDWIRIDANVTRGKGGATQPWRTIFFGYVTGVEFGAQYNEEANEDTIITAGCQLFWLTRNMTNYWLGIPGTFGSNDASERIRKLTNDGGQGALFSSTAEALKIMFNSLIYTFFPMRRQLESGSLRWIDTHGYRFESDRFVQGLNMEQFAPHASSWMQGIMDLVDMPHFYQIYCDVLPRTRILTGKGIHEQPKVGSLGFGSERSAKKDTGLIFPGDRADSIIVRPLPFPEYHEYGGYDSQAWDALPTFSELPHFGAMQLAMRKGGEDIYTYYSTTSIVGNGAEIAGVTLANSIATTIHDRDKHESLCGYAPLSVGTRRLPYAGTTEDERNGKTPSASDVDDRISSYGEFLGFMNETLFSFHQFNDRFYTATHTGTINLDLELGGRFRFDRGKMLGFIDGYTHTFTPTDATTVVSITRALNVAAYQEELPATMGIDKGGTRKRRDETLRPLKQSEVILGADGKLTAAGGILSPNSPNYGNTKAAP